MSAASFDSRGVKALERIELFKRGRDEAQRNIDAEVLKALDAGVPVAKIGEALGVSRQAVHERYITRARG